MIIHAHPTDADYTHALAAHATWAQVAAQTRVWRNPFIYIWMVCLGGMMVLLISPELVSKQVWGVNAVSLMAMILVYPLVTILFGVKAMLASSATLRPEANGIVERKITVKGKPQVPTSKTWYGWVVFVTVAVMLFLYMSRHSGNLLNTTPPPTGMVMQETGESAEPVSGATLFFISLFAWMAAIKLTATLQKKRQTRNLLISTPSLLLPKTWEMTEDWIAERGELLQTTMKWEFILKFLETPNVMMLYPNEQSFYLIPKAAFSGETEYDEFVALLMRKVPNGVMQPRGERGFPVQPIPAIPLPQGDHER